jgi:hypothetical protein
MHYTSSAVVIDWRVVWLCFGIAGVAGLGTIGFVWLLTSPVWRSRRKRT